MAATSAVTAKVLLRMARHGAGAALPSRPEGLESAQHEPKTRDHHHRGADRNRRWRAVDVDDERVDDAQRVHEDRCCRPEETCPLRQELRAPDRDAEED